MDFETKPFVGAKVKRIRAAVRAMCSIRISSAMLVRDSRTSSANGAFGRQDRQDSDGKKPSLKELSLLRRARKLVAWEDSIRGKCCGTLAQRIGNPSLAFGPVMASTARGTSAQRQNFG
jgi:hypothetical protein